MLGAVVDSENGGMVLGLLMGSPKSYFFSEHLVHGSANRERISLGCWEPSWILKMEGWFLDYSWEVRNLISSANIWFMAAPTEKEYEN